LLGYIHVSVILEQWFRRSVPTVRLSALRPAFVHGRLAGSLARLPAGFHLHPTDAVVHTIAPDGECSNNALNPPALEATEEGRSLVFLGSTRIGLMKSRKPRRWRRIERPVGGSRFSGAMAVAIFWKHVASCSNIS